MKQKDFKPPCKKCGGQCCKYVSVEIDKPRTKRDYDNMRWYLLHKDVNIYLERDKKWYIQFISTCDSLSKDNRCSKYDIRPKLCREHGREEGECEFYDSPYLLYFTSAGELEKYLEKKGIEWRFMRL